MLAPSNTIVNCWASTAGSAAFGLALEGGVGAA
jgi:hypothetical protein